MTQPVIHRAGPNDDRPLTKNIIPGQPPLDRKGYEATGGYQAVRHSLKHLASSEVTEKVKAAYLRGRGGAGFPTGVKWGLVPMGENAPKKKYLVCNADEMEPGTFKDRLLMEGDPHLLVESMIVSGYAIQASTGYIFLRGEYVVAAQRLNQAIQEARAAGYLGQNILGSGWSFDLHVHTGAGRYICGEETALINSLEGKRANPRAKPPFPQIVGLWGKPTVVNNVETLCNVPSIVLRGPEWFQKLSKSKDSGTKLYGVSGRVKRPGCWELPMGTSVREILFDYAGGMQDGLKFRGLLPGGASTDFLVEQHLDLPMDYDSVARAGSRMGTGTMIILDDQASLLGMLRNLEEFFARESCGWCTPCRDGLPWTVKLLKGLEEGRGRPEDIQMLESMTKLLGPGRTFCAHAPGAMEPLQSALKYFRADFERGVANQSAAA